jgi:acetyl esterase/lipase
LSGESWSTREQADPYLTRPRVTELVQSYLNGQDASHPLASPLHADLAGIPPIRIHVANDEMLLDDSIRFVEHAVAAGGWMHMWTCGNGWSMVSSERSGNCKPQRSRSIGAANFCQDDLQHPPATEDPRAIEVATQ